MDKLNGSCEPMEIDTSARSNQSMDISFNDSINDSKREPIDSNTYLKHIKSEPKLESTPLPPAENATPTPVSITTPQLTNIKKFHIIRQKKVKNTLSLKLKMIFTSLVVLISIAAYQYFNVQCSDDLNIDSLRQTLSKNLFGQYQATNHIIEALNANEKRKILFFYGGTGVGKTYTISLLLNEIGYHSNIYHYTMPSFAESFSTDLMIGLTICKQSIVIVDDLKLEYDIYKHIDDLVTKTEDLGKSLTIILVYSCRNTDGMGDCDIEFISKLIKQFEKIKSFKKAIEFESLLECDLQSCIEHELRRKITETEFLKFRRNFDVTTDGCKGVHHKIRHLDIN